MLKLNRIVFLLAVIFFSNIFHSYCADEKSSTECLDNGEVSKTINQILDFVSNSYSMGEPLSKGNIVLVEDRCWKKKYKIKNDYLGSIQIVIYKDPNEADSGISYFLNSKHENAIPSGQCLNRALQIVDAMDAYWANNIIQKHRESKSWQWEDKDLGPMQFLDCGGTETLEFYESVALMLHELNHFITYSDSPCIYNPFDDNEMCFDLDPEFPAISSVAFDRFPTDNERSAYFLEIIQNTYLEGEDRTFLNIAGELLSYSIELAARAKILDFFGKRAVVHSDGMRQGAIMNLFMVYMVRYLNFIKKNNKELYESKFCINCKNYIFAKKLLSISEYIHNMWIQALNKYSLSQRDFEENLWNIYEQGK